jgi:hypothetical protein
MVSKGWESQLKHGCFDWCIERLYNILVNYHSVVCTLELVMTELPTHDIPYPGTKGEMNERRRAKKPQNLIS